MTSCHSHPKNILQISVHPMCSQSVHLYQPIVFFFIYIIFLLHHSPTFLACAYIMRGIPKIEISEPYLFNQGDFLLDNMFPYKSKQNRCQQLGKIILIASPIWASWSVMIIFGATPCMHLSYFLKNQTNESLCSSTSNAQPNKRDCWWWFT